MKIYDVVLAVIRALVLVELIRELANLIFGGVGLAIAVSSLDSVHTVVTGDISKTLLRTELTTGVLGAFAPIVISLFIFAASRRLASLIVQITVPSGSATQPEAIAPSRP